VTGGGDEDDAADEQLFMQQSLELHYNVAELVGEHSRGIHSHPILLYIQLFSRITSHFYRIIVPFRRICVQDSRVLVHTYLLGAVARDGL
jgi:hypothetical protein